MTNVAFKVLQALITVHYTETGLSMLIRSSAHLYTIKYKSGFKNFIPIGECGWKSLSLGMQEFISIYHNWLFDICEFLIFSHLFHFWVTGFSLICSSCTFLLCTETGKSGPGEYHKSAQKDHIRRLGPSPAVSLYPKESSLDFSGISHVCQCPPVLLKLQDQGLGHRRGSRVFEGPYWNFCHTFYISSVSVAK